MSPIVVVGGKGHRMKPRNEDIVSLEPFSLKAIYRPRCGERGLYCTYKGA